MPKTGKRSRNIFDPQSSKPFKLSRSRLDLFINCPRCFYLDRRLGVDRPSGPPFTLNTAVDTLLKKEFDQLRAQGKQHPLQKQYGIDEIPVSHKDLDIWRENFKGLQYHHSPSNFIVTGAIDDLWQNPKGEYVVVDYKATAKSGRIEKLDKGWHDGYKRQMEVYQWLLRQLGHPVSDLGYFVYCNGRTDREAFDGKLEFDVTLIPYKGNDSWVESKLVAARKCLENTETPASDDNCEFCAYRQAAIRVMSEKRDAKGGQTKLEI